MTDDNSPINKEESEEGIVHEYAVEPLIEKAIQEAEATFPGRSLIVDVEMTEELTVRISVIPTSNKTQE